MKTFMACDPLYAYSDCREVAVQVGLIGYLRADMDTNGLGFFSSWEDFRKELKTEPFKSEFDDIINELRKEGCFLHDRATLAKFCSAHPEFSFGKDSLGNEREFGVRINTDKYAYMMRLNPNKGEYNLYCYCYRKDWLDAHIAHASKGIRFIDSHYNELFRIPDGGKIILTTAKGQVEARVCRYLDDYHLMVGRLLFHICEFAESMEREGTLYSPKE